MRFRLELALKPRKQVFIEGLEPKQKSVEYTLLRGSRAEHPESAQFFLVGVPRPLLWGGAEAGN